MSQTGREIHIDVGENGIAAYVATPGSGQGPGVIVLQEWWGLVPQIRDVCDRLARAGFVALAPDLYHGESTTDPDVAGRLMMELEVERAGRDLEAAVDALRREPATTGSRVGCIGFCMGGQLALYAACRQPEIAAVVDCYGVHPKVSVDFSDCRAKVLGIFAENDEFISAEDVQHLREALEKAGVEAKIVVYEGVGHAFLNDARPEVYDAEKAALAWREIETFFEAELR
ncbi:MAG TPA: dienelactone hydrolase family protein [Deltaproteobacteria bacterium]|nr:dienelactone hydrolase family protein [Deltaproteobacteria bacterium]